MSALKVLEQRRRRQPAAENLPFTIEVVSSRLSLRVPIYAKVEMASPFWWVTLVDGSTWKGQGIFFEGQDLAFTLPLWTRLRVQLHGRTWIVAHETDKIKAERPDKNAIRRFLHSTGFSFAIHGTIFFLLLLASRFGRMKLGDVGQDLTLAPKPEPTKVAPPAGAAGGGGGFVPRPYEGITFSKFMNQVAAKAPPKDQMNNLLAKMQKMSSPNVGSGSASGAGLKGATGVGFGSAAAGKGNGTGLTGSVEGQAFNKAEAMPTGNRKLTDAERNLLRKKFRECQDEFKRIYSRLLSQDPTLSVTLSLRAKVSPSGYLSLESFNARGTYKAASLAQLKSEIGRVLGAVYVGTELAGVGLTGENVFVR